MSTARFPQRVVSGGQTGVDRAALDAARELDIPHGGWCPRGRRAEDGRVPAEYALRETATRDYAERTQRNVLDSDGTLILHRGPLTGGTLLTRQLAERCGRPTLLVDLDAPLLPALVRGWCESHAIATLNIAGPRESSAPGIYQKARHYLVQALNTNE